MIKATPRVLIIYPYPSIDTNPTMVFLLESLAHRNVQVDLLAANGGDFLIPEPFGNNVHFEFLPHDFFFNWLSLIGLPARLARRLLASKPNMNYRLRFDHSVFRLFQLPRYSIVIGVDPFGIVLADSLNRWAKKPLVYLSFELILSEELDSRSELQLKAREKSACERTSLVLIQDQERAEVFCRDNSVPYERLAMVPVAPPPQAIVRSEYLRKKLGIPSSTRIVLYCGNLESWAGRDELEEMVSYWTDNYCLVVHSRSKARKAIEQYLEKLKKTGKILVSDEPVSRKDMCELVSSADFGLAPYKPVPQAWWTGKNLYHLGLSSGKVSYYAMCGLPILARSLPVFEREFSTYQCGKIYRRIAETGLLLEEMSRNYEHYSQEAVRFFHERLSPVAGMQTFCNRVIALAGLGQ